MNSSAKSERDQWFLEGFIDDSSAMQRIPVKPLPFRVGRRSSQSFVISSDEISKEHAEIYEDDASLWIRDLRSTNGTFVNDDRVEAPCQLEDGDVIRFAAFEFRLKFELLSDTGLGGETTVHVPTMDPLSKRLVMGTRELPHLFDERAVVPYYQLILDLENQQRLGYEVLGRGAHDRLPTSPIELFRIASIAGREAELSELFRNEGVRVAAALDAETHLFLNTHPKEIESPRLLESLRELRAMAGDRQISLEIHERAIANLERIRELRAALATLDIGLAYDDFGVGEPRLLEIADTPPDFLKFDAQLILDIDSASDRRRQMVESLVRMARDLGIACIAEGIESSGEMDVCTQIGFQYGQGYFFGRPCSVGNL